jgi:branched-chain amino acid transport system ATP-binding protein
MIARLRHWLDDVTGGDPTFPLLVLAAIYFFDEFDTAAFGVLAPEIKHSFDISNETFVQIIGANLSVVLLLAIPVSHFGDRLPRRTMVVTGAIIAGVFSFFTGLAPTVLLLVLFRMGNGIGLLVNDPIHRSLLSDYYKPEARPTVFATHANAVRVGAIFGSAIAGILAFAFGWRAAFLVLIVPIVGVAILALRLPPVFRGQSDDADVAAAAAEEKPFPFMRSARILWNVSTLRRQYIAWIFIGAAFLPLAAYIPIYLDDEFHLNPLELGFLTSVGAAVALVAVQLSGRMTRKAMAKGLGEPLRIAALALVAVGPTMLILAVAPNLAVAIGGILVANFVGGFFAVPYITVQAMVSPARARSLSFGFGSLFLVVGLNVYSIFFASTANDSVRAGLAWLAPLWIIGGLILWSAKGLVGGDTTRALSVMQTTAQLRRERENASERSLLVCRNVDVSYGQTQVLFGVDFDVKEGEVVALLGTNGAGKSTLLKAVAGSIDINGGAIFCHGEDMTGLGAAAVTATGVVLVPGGKGVFPGLTVAENLQLAGWLLRKDQGFVDDVIDEALGYFPVLRERWDQKAGNLSGGEQQMLTIAMALLARPKLLMIDELSLGLAPIVVEMLLDVVRRISERGVTVILVEQSVNVALTLAQRAVFMEKGEIRFDGPTADLLDRPDVLRSVFLEGAATAVDTDHTETRQLVRTPFVPPTDRKGRAKPSLLEVRDLSVSFGGIRAVNGVDLDVRDGEIVGLIGPNGAGKTTIFDLICGLLPADSGSVTLDGEVISGLTADARGRRGLGRSFQDARLFPSMTVRETIAVALERHLPVKDPLAAAFASPATRAVERDVDRKVDRLIELMRLQAFANKFVFELSTGSRRIVDLACTLAHEPTVLLLDEPSSGIAQRETEALGPLLLDIRDETGAALLVIEHDMPLITGISDSIVALELGAVVVQGAPHDVINDPRVVAAYLGTTEETIHRSGDLRAAPAPKRRRREPLTAGRGG